MDSNILGVNDLGLSAVAADTSNNAIANIHRAMMDTICTL